MRDFEANRNSNTSLSMNNHSNNNLTGQERRIVQNRQNMQENNEDENSSIRLQNKSPSQIKERLEEKLRFRNFSFNFSLNFTEKDFSLNLTEEDILENKTHLAVHLSNGRNAQIKIMPETAAERALERLRLKVCNSTNNCSIELKETGIGEKIRATYSVKLKKEAKILFGLFKTKMDIETEVDAETGDIISVKKPWWSFLSN